MMEKNNWAYRYDMLRYLDNGTVDFVTDGKENWYGVWMCWVW